MPALPVIAYAVSAAATIGSAVMANKASKDAQSNAQAVGQYNAQVDRADAQQIDLNTQANIAAMRRDAATYMSRQAAAYAGAGIVANTGSALQTQVATAGRFALREQQAFVDAGAQEQKLELAAQEGIRESTAQGEEYALEGEAAVMNGASKLVSGLYSGYKDGVFNFGTNNLSQGLT